jgi:hydroxymethylbilane synthase
VGIDCLTDRQEIASLLSAVNHDETFTCVMAERAFLEGLGGNCHSPAAALARISDGKLVLTGQILSEDGSESHIGISDNPNGLAMELLEKASAALRTLFQA